ncbi:hypothetical protein VE00_04316 [Pseudogymnoascus sp. WSF 3629]|nr:hypothetical protein VE00_04316 [Pseudogymnoascus sp. WSF 3629]
MSMNIHPDWLQVEQELGSRPVLAGRYEDIRAGSDQLMAVLNPLYALPSPEPKVSGETLPSGIVVRIFHPGVPSQNSLPVGIFFHSGGWTSGNVEGEKATCYHLAHYVPAIIVAVSYRLAPEYKAPTAHRDAVEAFLWTVTNSRRLGGDPKKLFCIGGSAGGNLALSVALRAIELKMSVAGVAAMVPVTVHPDAVPPQHKSLYTSYAEFTNTPIINTSSMNTFYGE